MAKDSHFWPNATHFLQRNTADVRPLRMEGKASAVSDCIANALRGRITRDVP